MRTLSERARRIRWFGLLLLVSVIVAGPARGQNSGALPFSLGGIRQTRSFHSSKVDEATASDIRPRGGQPQEW